MGLAFGLLLMFSLSANASIVYNGAWFSLDQDADPDSTATADASALGLAAGWEFHVFDPVAGTGGSSIKLLDSATTGTVSFFVSPTEVSLNSDFSLALSITGGEFGFYFIDTNSSAIWDTLTIASKNPPTDSVWWVEYDDDTDDLQRVEVTDVSPVPIPSAILLLGSGLMGLVGFRRKFQG